MPLSLLRVVGYTDIVAADESGYAYVDDIERAADYRALMPIRDYFIVTKMSAMPSYTPLLRHCRLLYARC